MATASVCQDLPAFFSSRPYKFSSQAVSPLTLPPLKLEGSGLYANVFIWYANFSLTVTASVRSVAQVRQCHIHCQTEVCDWSSLAQP